MSKTKQRKRLHKFYLNQARRYPDQWWQWMLRAWFKKGYIKQ